jgi:hypothetical protein
MEIDITSMLEERRSKSNHGGGECNVLASDEHDGL